MTPKPKIVGLCGTSGSGKTLTCQKMVAELRSAGVGCCGFISPAVFEKTEKTAIKVQWLESGEEHILLSSVTPESQLRFGRWQIHPDVFDWINHKLESLQYCKVFLCDEIGPLEVLEGKGWVGALDFVEERKFELALTTFRPSLREYFEQRFTEMTIYDLDQPGTREKVMTVVRNMFGIGQSRQNQS